MFANRRTKPAKGLARGFSPWEFLRDASGAHAVEFALIAPVFLLLLLSCVQLGLIMFTQADLDDAAYDAARLIMVGTVQESSDGAATFDAKLCSEVNVLIPCSSLQYNVQSGSSFAALNSTVQTDSEGNMVDTEFTPGVQGSDVLVQVGYNMTCVMPLICRALSANGNLLLQSNISFENENY
jgi:Flp pilus assembly protein TadG